jgi:uracil-DNA glycosylase
VAKFENSDVIAVFICRLVFRHSLSRQSTHQTTCRNVVFMALPWHNALAKHGATMSLETKLAKLVCEVRACTVCAKHLPLPPNPILRVSKTARLLIVGQAPGLRVHNTSIPWNDPSGDRLRLWLQLAREEFYDESKIAIVPAGLCYPGTGEGGDLPPRPECAPLWHPRLRAAMPQIRLTLLVGSYAQEYYLGSNRKNSIKDTVSVWNDYLPEFIPLPHPSPRNIRWFKVNSWFDAEVVPAMRKRVKAVLNE